MIDKNAISPVMTMTMEDSDPFSVYQFATLAVEDASLVVVEGPNQGAQLQLDRELLHIGRAEWCDLSLSKDGRASSHHCEIRMDAQGIIIRDLNSRNGLYLNGARVLQGFLTPKTSIQIGQSRLEFRSNSKKKEIEISYFDQSGQLVGQSPKMRQIFSMMQRLGSCDLPVLLTGETGTGKSSIARALHKQSNRKRGPFVTVNCGALSPSLVEASLFGYEKGAFTGATNQHKGFFEQADGGTLFLDEIGELPIDLQPKLLDVVERKCLQRLGGHKEIESDFRLIVATHRDLQEEVKKKTFRQDLYYRLSVVELNIPALRDRKEDIPLLIKSMLRSISPDRQIHFTDEAMGKLKHYLWPGNVRQLCNILERNTLFLEEPTITKDSLYLPDFEEEEQQEELSSSSSSVGGDGSGQVQIDLSALGETPIPLKQLLEETERTILQKTLAKTGWNVQKASHFLEITSGWLYNRMRKYKLKKDS